MSELGYLPVKIKLWREGDWLVMENPRGDMEKIPLVEGFPEEVREAFERLVRASGRGKQ
jgi:hypothetical protein